MEGMYDEFGNFIGELPDDDEQVQVSATNDILSLHHDMDYSLYCIAGASE